MMTCLECNEDVHVHSKPSTMRTVTTPATQLQRHTKSPPARDDEPVTMTLETPARTGSDDGRDGRQWGVGDISSAMVTFVFRLNSIAT